MENPQNSHRPLHTLFGGQLAELLRPYGYQFVEHLACCTQADLAYLGLAPHICAIILAKMANDGMPILDDEQMQERIIGGLRDLLCRRPQILIEEAFGKKWVTLFKNRRIETLAQLLEKIEKWGELESWPHDIRFALQSQRMFF